MNPLKRPRVVIAGDQPLIAEEYARLLESEFEVVVIIADEKALLEKVQEDRPDLIILDVGALVTKWLEAGKRIKKLARTVRIVYLTTYTDIGILAEVLRGGARGYLLETLVAAELVNAVREALKGGQYISPLILQHVGGSSPETRDSHTSPEQLSDRQREVLKLLAEGRTMKEIAYILQLTPRTIAFHKYDIMERLHLRTNADLVRYAIREHVITPGS